MALIYLLKLGKVDDRILAYSEQRIQRTFGVSTRINGRIFDIKDTYDGVRNQYHSAKLLKMIIENPPPDALKVFGITEGDLFLPIFTFLFGEAQLNGIGALLSLHRLRNEFYGLRPDPDRLKIRVEKEVLHELGHTFGLVHCFDPACVMRPSTYVEDVDQKSDEFCEHCRFQLATKIGL